jgi:hypothetical protein
MFWPIFLYLIASIVVAISAGGKAGIETGIFVFLASALALIAGGGLKASIWYGDRGQKIAGPIIAAAIMGVSLWAARGFSVQLFGYYLSGTLWSIIGATVCFVFANKKLCT